ncbi:IclR family transcriptional regulator [Pontivivens nitratireducens]|uniref:IclR family transcriptional regulator n=1 Tax=Pontivivens nitratireducens TaxID=2758038 RepID=UPI00163B181A|nr:IclR family transcriptional regulator C-terminal domain-containing protein [Pontibrevibacter nitratireducens]
MPAALMAAADKAISMEKSGEKKQSSAGKVLNVLDLFTEENPAWTVEMIMSELGATRATAYRYVKALYDAGLLAPGAASTYVLGPRIMQLDRQIRRSDPLLKIAQPLLDEDQSPLIGARSISSFYGDQVLAIQVDRFDPEIFLTMERGRSFPLIYGAPSRIILAYLPPYQMRNFYSSNSAEISKAGLGKTWEEFRTSMRKMRRIGYCVGNESNRTVYGVSAPIFHDKSSVSASLTYVRRIEITSDQELEELIKAVVRAANRISEKLINYSPADGDSSLVFPTPRLAG